MAATRMPVHMVAHAVARNCWAPRTETGNARSAVSWRVRNTFRLVNQSAVEVADKSTKPGHTDPRCSRKIPSNNGGKNPPSPPKAPTSPPTVAVSFGKYCGTSLNTAPFPRPSNAAQPSAPTVNGTIAGQANNSANNAMPGNTPPSTRAPPMRSDSHPPTGRNSVASTTKPAARNPASVTLIPKSSRNSNGR